MLIICLLFLAARLSILNWIMASYYCSLFGSLIPYFKLAFSIIGPTDSVIVTTIGSFISRNSLLHVHLIWARVMLLFCSTISFCYSAMWFCYVLIFLHQVVHYYLVLCALIICTLICCACFWFCISCFLASGGSLFVVTNIAPVVTSHADF